MTSRHDRLICIVFCFSLVCYHWLTGLVRYVSSMISKSINTAAFLFLDGFSSFPLSICKNNFLGHKIPVNFEIWMNTRCDWHYLACDWHYNLWNNQKFDENIPLHKLSFSYFLNQQHKVILKINIMENIDGRSSLLGNII